METRGPAISILFGFWTSVVCDTYAALSWNKRIQSGPGASASSANHTPAYSGTEGEAARKEGQTQVPEANDIQTFSSLDAAISIKSLFVQLF